MRALTRTDSRLNLKTSLVLALSSIVIAAGLVVGVQQPALAAACASGTQSTGFSGGDGQSAATAWEISSSTDLIRLSELHQTTSELRDDLLRQTADIDLGGTCTWTPIGHDYSIKFGGVYDGRGFKISGLFINLPTGSPVGLFGVSDSGTVKNLSLSGVNVTGGERVGAAVGFLSQSSSLQNVKSSGVVNGVMRAGGLVGQLSTSSTLTNSYSSANVVARDWPNRADLGVDRFGGLVGFHEGGTVSNSYSTGTVTDSSVKGAIQRGGLTGNGTAATNNSFWDTVSSGQPTSARGTGKSTDEMKDLATFNNTDTVGLATAWAIVDGWEAFNFDAPTNFWGICSAANGGYPFLLWEFIADPCVVQQDGGLGGNTGGGAPAGLSAVPPAMLLPLETRQRLAPRAPLAPPPIASGPVLRADSFPAPPQAPTALIGGVRTSLQQTFPDPTTLSLVTGSVSLALSVVDGSGASEREGVTQLGVKNGSSVDLAGSGLLAGSTVQVFIPLGAGVAREVAQLVVNSDGTFSGVADFSTDPLAAPLPIGPRLLQMVTVDENGNQVVLEMTVAIEQSDPNPELNRERGEIPSMTLGSLEATSAGLPVEANITAVADQKLAVVEGEGWTMAVNIDAPGGAVEENETGAVLTLVRDETALVSGSGFMAGTRADVWLFSEPTLVGTVTIDENGEFSGAIDIDPSKIPAGEHTLQLQGVGTDGYVKAANLGVLVEDAGAAVSVAQESSFSWAFLWWIILVIVAVLALWFVLRRRSAAPPA